ncbi:TPA: hypothetical protein DCZ46_01855 [Candidatus Campbellbacteria bacterium]|jgi:hypothetical protein|nr:MAG: hypothetical protein UR74_C0001G0032 [Candidatus Campbellbacteria bacterium GW2011_GWD2_35_24]KKP76263.1 MAG: hypothetical protein UR75_C0001G0297 [Candidatus Campbellbacteria bacterium GW2011_GWC2_35_28]KKP77452.1 MAG: hypothetical protein UR76_C0001G0297 [Candidatus Campbellbacteria bacterium GW2011_GWC1_35_31]KKP79381.1 MAG: hypothetical protein UR79_C0001G0297 [Candidatus Campbellbacteria bacterium GW2011_GWD1_35_49]HAP73992.1 hypothetical protein [Candidatus Campbellbacteria bacter
MSEKNNEMVLIISLKRKPDGSFTGKVEGQGNDERRAREELFTIPSIEIAGKSEVLKKIGDKVLNEALTNFARIFDVGTSVKTNLE